MKTNDYVILILVGVYITLLPLAPSSRLEWLLSGIFVIIGLIYLTEIFFIKAIKQQFKDNLKNVFINFFTIAFVLFIVVMGITTISSKAPIISLKELIRYGYYLAVYFIIRLRFNKEYMYEIIIKIYLFSTLIVSILGIIDFFKFYTFGQSVEEMILYSRARSILDYHNTFAAYLILAIFPAILISINVKGIKRAYYSLLSMLLIINLAVTFSKNGWVALAVGFLTLSIIYSRKFVFLYMIPILGLLMSKNIYARIIAVFESSYSDSRIKLWKIAESMIRENMFVGVGSGNFRTMYTQYVTRFPELKLNETIALPPHNSYIRVFAEIGVFGAVVFLILCFEMLKSIYYVREKCTTLVKYFYSGFLISTMTFLMMNIFDDLFYTPKVTMNFLLFIFISYNISASWKGEGTQSKKQSKCL